MASSAPITGAPTRAPLTAIFDEIERVGSILSQAGAILNESLSSLGATKGITPSDIEMGEGGLTLIRYADQRLSAAMDASDDAMRAAGVL